MVAVEPDGVDICRRAAYCNTRHVHVSPGTELMDELRPLARNSVNVLAEGMGISMTVLSYGDHLDGGRAS